jgi:hypothetical protein
LAELKAAREVNMRRSGLFLFLSIISIPIGLRAQANTPPNEVHVRDGGTREVLESITVPPLANAPFVATLQTEWVRALPDGGTITVVNARRIARDGSGRIYQERWLLVPKNGKQKSEMNAIQISDPNTHTLYTCLMNGKHICDLTNYSASTSTIYSPEGPPTGPLPNDAGYAIHENLGNQSFSGVDTSGSRESITYQPGVFGNDQKVTATREYWFSSKLGISLLSIRSDPRFGTQTFAITELGVSEPEAQLFELPEGFKVMDQRQTAPPAAN